MMVSEKAEDVFIQRYFASLATGPEAFGLHDDAAQIPVPDGHSLVVSTDTLVSDVHFFDADPAKTIAQKALRVNLSDLAAKGSVPEGYFLSLAMPGERLMSPKWMSEFSSGLAADQKEFSVRLMGGDTVRTSGFSVVTICAFGFVPDGAMVKRSGAKPGDKVYVSGTIGNSAIGLLARKNSLFGKQGLSIKDQAILDALDAEAHLELEKSYLLPEPKVLAATIVQTFASASMDISDGLAGDAQSLANASGVGLEFFLERIPYCKFAKDHLHLDGMLQKLLNGGDDYEILCTIPAAKCLEFEHQMNVCGAVATAVGCVIEHGGVSFLDRDNNVFAFDTASFDQLS